MNITIFGATGGVGRHLVEQATDAGHTVTAVVRHPDKLSRDVRVVRADLSDPSPAALRSAVLGTDGVLSALGPRSKQDALAHIVTRATTAIVAAMDETATRRLLVVSAVPVPTVPSPARPHPPKRDPADDLFMRAVLNPIVKAVFRATYLDLAETEDVVSASGLDWTIVRPPRLLDRPLTGNYRTASDTNVPGGRSISRADLAHFMLAALDRVETVHRAVRVAS